MSFDLIINNGKVVLADCVLHTQVGVKNGKIKAIGDGLTGGKEIIDAKGMYVLPGVVDVHVHLCEPGRTEWEGFETGTRALAKGGTTSYVDMPLNNLPATIDGETIRLKAQHAEGQNYVDYAFYGGLVPHNLGKLHELDQEGAAAYKCFVSTCGFDVPGDFKDVNDYVLYKGMLELKELDQMLSIHCENAAICDNLAAEAIASGKKDVDSYVESRAVFTEVEAVRRVLYLGKITGCKLHFVHLSAVDSIKEVLAAKAEGMDVSVESCPHYLNLTREIFADELGPVGKCSPPLRSKEETEQMWEALFRGEIDILASDHSPCPPDMKENEESDIFKSWGGLSACQNVLDIMFDEAVQKRGMCPSQLMKVLAHGPASRFGLIHKGEIALDKDADFVLLKPDSHYVLKAEELEYKHKHSPYVGREIGCQVIKTFVRGNLVYDKARGIVGEPIGKRVKKNQ